MKIHIRVSLVGERDFDVHFIAITLQARCKTKIIKGSGQSRRIYRGRAPLINIKKLLFTGPHTLHPGHSWPFTFTLPLQCHVRPTDAFDPSGRLFDLNPAQQLPPPILDSYIPGFGNWHAECFIKYELEATLVGSGNKVFSLGDLSSTRSLNFRTFRPVQLAAPQPIVKTATIECFSLHLKPGFEEASLTLKEKLQSMRRSKLPSAKFRILAMLPQVGTVGQPLPISLSLKYDSETSTNPESPVVLLRKCTVQLQALTHVQAICESIFMQDTMVRDWDNSHDIGSVDFSERMKSAPALTENFNLGEVMRLIIPGFPPTFSTFNIRRTYRLRLKLSVQCAQKDLKADYHTSDLVLLARDYMPSAVGVNAMPSVAADEVAPAYQNNSEPPPPSYYEPKPS